MSFVGIISDMNGILLVDKPVGWTSFDVVAKIRGQVRQAMGNKKAKVVNMQEPWTHLQQVY